MIIQVTSDLHLEYMEEWNLNSLITKEKAKFLFLAGDIGSLYRINQLKKFLEEVCKMYEYVLYVPGNHEFYKLNENEDGICMQKLKDRLHSLSVDIKNLIILDKKSVQIGEYCIIGCTLWSNSKSVPKRRVKIHGIDNSIYNMYHNQDLEYIQNMIEYCQKNSLKLIVMTHYPPTREILLQRHLKDCFSDLYATPLDHLLTKDQVNLWICGHTHSNFDYYTENGTRLVANQLGRKKEINKSFLKNYEIILE